MSLIETLQLIPNEIYAVAVGGAIAMIPVLLSNRAQRKEAERERVHREEESKIAREHALRKEIYLSVLRSVTAATEYLGKIQNIPQEQLSGLGPPKEFTSAMSAMSLVASKETITATQLFGRRYVRAILSLYERRIRLVNAQVAVADTQQQIEDRKSQANSLVAVANEMAARKQQEDPLFSRIGERFATINDELAVLHRTQAENHAKQGKIHFEFGNAIANETLEMTPLIASTVTAIRAEMNLPLDEAWYTQITKQSLDDFQEALREFTLSLSESED